MSPGAGELAFACVDPSGAEAQQCLGQYFDELAARFPEGFDRERDGGGGLEDFAPPAGCFLIARRDGRPIGCAALRALETGIGEVKRMWVAREARGRGLGRSILLELERLARHRGMRVMRLDTHQTLSEALELYRASGYREIGRFNNNRYAHHWFEKTLD